jgi:hypothetical protein
MIKEKYFVRTEPIDNTERYGPNTWNSLEVTVFQKNEDGTEERLGSYERDYHTLYQTFHPFRKDGRDYALYSPRYTATRVMALPSCEDFAGEEPSPYGFCPVEYYVPEEKNEDARLAFVSGCVWGDDTHWKVQYLDLSGIDTGTMNREEKFGYHVLPRGIPLRDAIKLFDDEDEYWIEIATFTAFSTDKEMNEVYMQSGQNDYSGITSNRRMGSDIEVSDMRWIQLPLVFDNNFPVSDMGAESFTEK